MAIWLIALQHGAVRRGDTMLDGIFVLAAIAFFVASAAFVRGCEHI